MNGKAEKVFKKFRWIAKDIARRTFRHYGKTYREVLGNAEFALVMILNEPSTFDPGRNVSIKTWLWRKVYWYIKEVYVRGRHPHHTDLREFRAGEIPFSCWDKEWLGNGDEETSGSCEIRKVLEERLVVKPNWFQNLLQEVSEEGQVLLRTVVEAPKEVLAELYPKRRTPDIENRRQVIKAYLVDVLDWDHSKLDRAWKEVQECLLP